MKSTATGIKRILNAFIYSRDGFISAFKSEAAFRQDILFVILSGILLFFIPFDIKDLPLLLLSDFLILLMELTNTAVETTIDRCGEEFHPLSKKAKDIGSLLVLIAFINWFVVWGICLFPMIKSFF